MEELTLNALLHDVDTAVERGSISRQHGAALRKKMRMINETHEFLRSYYRNIPRARLLEHLRRWQQYAADSIW